MLFYRWGYGSTKLWSHKTDYIRPESESVGRIMPLVDKSLKKRNLAGGSSRCRGLTAQCWGSRKRAHKRKGRRRKTRINRGGHLGSWELCRYVVLNKLKLPRPSLRKERKEKIGKLSSNTADEIGDCVSYFSYHCDQNPEQKQLKEERIRFGLWLLRAQSMVVWSVVTGACVFDSDLAD